MWAFLKVGIEVDWSRTDEAEGLYPFELNAEVTGMFQWSPASAPKTERMARLWLDYNGIYLLWAYLRTHVATITGMSDLPPLTIYTMRVPDRPQLDEDDDEEKAKPTIERASG
jgi:preprotein translocase subunit SecB